VRQKYEVKFLADLPRKEAKTMIDANEVLQEMCEKYEAAVNANDSAAYRQLFASDAIRIPPQSEPEHGADEIAKSEQKDYDIAKWTVQLTPLDALKIDDRWVYGIAQADINTVAYADGVTNVFKATPTWLFHREDSGEWLIARQIWNLKSG
jgi:ketosteroid isomerase-like protein